MFHTFFAKYTKGILVVFLLQRKGHEADDDVVGEGAEGERAEGFLRVQRHGENLGGTTGNLTAVDALDVQLLAQVATDEGLSVFSCLA